VGKLQGAAFPKEQMDFGEVFKVWAGEY